MSNSSAKYKDETFPMYPKAQNEFLFSNNIILPLTDLYLQLENFPLAFLSSQVWC
jgi:hypothetical protein